MSDPTSTAVLADRAELIERIQQAIRAADCEGWLLYDFRNSNILARRVLRLDGELAGSRRWGYFIPAHGTPRKLVHRIESQALQSLPGETQVYLRWQEFEAGIGWLIGNAKTIAMEYSPRLASPYVSKIDAGLMELVAERGPRVVSSGDLVQQFESVWDDSQWAMHQAAGKVTDSAYGLVWQFIAEQVASEGHTTELAVQKRILQHFHEHGMTTYAPPIVGVGPHSGDPHYETGNAPIRAGDYVLVDLWGKLDQPRAVYSDLTRVGYVGTEVPAMYERMFAIVAAARDAAIACIKQSVAQDRLLPGWEVDRACRQVIDAAGYGHAFVHRTGHSIGQEVHGNGANMDDLETHETRHLLPGSCCSIEPGIYLPEFGVRSEVNVFIGHDKVVHVTAGPLQQVVVPILREFTV